jgi:mRNA interferase MazF
MVKNTPFVPARGDLVWLQFAPQAGHEQSGRRLAVVVSPQSYNEKVGLCLCCPVTSHLKGYPFEVKLPAEQEIAGVVLCDQVKSLDWKARGAALIGTLPSLAVKDIQAKILTLIK